MIVVDTSALMAIIQDELQAPGCQDVLEVAEGLSMAAPSLTEALIVAAGRGVLNEMTLLLDTLSPSIIPLTESRARAAADAYRRWGKGFHPAKLNLGDSFAYALAMERSCPLLFVGDDFAQTDVVSALAG